MNLLSAIKKDTKTGLRACLYSDGGSRGNPGPAGCGGVIYGEKKAVLGDFHRFLGERTNNYAEYQGVIIGMQTALSLGVTELVVRMDSKLAIEQLAGRWKVKHPQIRILWQEAKGLEAQFEKVSYEHVRRELNIRADQLANLAMDRQA